MLYKSPTAAWNKVSTQSGAIALVNADCRKLLSALPDQSVSMVMTSPPYCMGKEYEPGNTIEDFVAAHEEVLPEIDRVLKVGGSICWQVGYHVTKNTVVPLDYLVYDVVRKLNLPLTMRNRIVWHFGSGKHAVRRFSGRHEMLLWFTKGDDYHFNLDPIRIPQKYPGKRSTKGPNQGELSGNPLGKNPSDTWDIPNVKANHCEKLEHPCQFPVALVRRMVLSLTETDDVVLDPFCGVASTGVAAALEGRRFIGSELNSSYAAIGQARLEDAVAGIVRVRLDQAVAEPNLRAAVAQRPESWPPLRAVG
ncbi:DNA-methyltransferase [Rhodanobacter umsongensis]